MPRARLSKEEKVKRLIQKKRQLLKQRLGRFALSVGLHWAELLREARCWMLKHHLGGTDRALMRSLVGAPDDGPTRL